MDLDSWLARCASELKIDDIPLSAETVGLLLDLARDAAHTVGRQSAPLTTFLVGVTVGRGVTIDAATAKATALLLGEQASGDGAGS